MDYKTWSINKAKNVVKTDPTSNNMVDIILPYLLLNIKQKVIVYKIMHYTIYNLITIRLKSLNQLLLVIRDKNSVDKS